MKFLVVVAPPSIYQFMNMCYSVGDDDRMFIEYWYLLKASDSFFGILNFLLDVFFAVSFFESSFYILF